MNPIPPKNLEVTYRDGKTEKVQVIESDFLTFYEACASRTPDTGLAERSVRLIDGNGLFRKMAPPDWIRNLDDESAISVVKASNEVNITPARAKKVGALTMDWMERQLPISETSSEPGNPILSS